MHFRQPNSGLWFASPARLGDNSEMESVHVRFFAAARAAAKADQMEVPVGTLREILTRLETTNADLARVIPQCSFLVDSVICHDFDKTIKAGSEIHVLPKFAGG